MRHKILSHLNADVPIRTAFAYLQSISKLCSALNHPTEKPVGLMQIFVEWTDGIVLDPFMGSGTTGVACAKMGRKFIGIEKEKKYLELVKNNPNFVKIVDSFEDNEYVFIVLEYYEIPSAAMYIPFLVLLLRFILWIRGKKLEIGNLDY